MTGQEISTRAVEGTAVVSSLERQLAVAQWLLTAAVDRDAARSQWEQHDVALLACGGVLSAIRAPAHLVRAAAGTDDLVQVDAHLQRWFDSGGVFMDLHSAQYYFLIPSGAAREFPRRDYPGVECLGRNHFLGVPSVRLMEPRGRSYWCVPMDGPGDLCHMDEVAQLLKEAQAARSEAGSR